MKSPQITSYIRTDTSYIVKAMVFPVVMYGCESWAIKKLSAGELTLLNCGVGADS